MHLHLTIAMLFLAASAGRAQMDHLHFPLRLTDGKPLAVFGPEEDIFRDQLRKAKIRFILVRKIKPKYLGGLDTVTVQARPFTPYGDPQPYDDSRGDFDGANRVMYDDKGRIHCQEWMYDQMLGCSNAHWEDTRRNRKCYEYEGSRRVAIRTGRTENLAQTSDTTISFHEIDAWRYDRNGRVTLRTRFSTSARKKDTFSLGDAVMFRYDRKGRPIHALIAEEDSLRNEQSESYRRVEGLLAQIPGDFTAIQLRRSDWGDTLTFRTYGDKDAMTDDANDRMIAEKALHDSLDDYRSAFFDAFHGRYQSLLKGYLGYQYDEQGRMSGRIYVGPDELSRKDTFMFDAQGRLARWIIWTPGEQYVHDNPWMEGLGWDYGTWTCRTYEYDPDGRVSTLLEAALAGQWRDRKKLQPVWERRLTLSYDAEGMATGIGSDYRKYTYGYNGSDTEARIEHDSADFIIQYEYYGKNPKSFREPGTIPAVGSRPERK